ncbi:MAG: cytochrome c biogenesis heme-transporting ATPase CcmA [Burkholderiaceae bacterium]|nr:cytochrome c biogenesis heme-transporting ATPase CcmA [Burkholderiaceae bacterium]
MTLQAAGLACTRGERHLFHDIHFELKGGEALRMAGTNGSGKTSMLRLLCGLAEPTAGEVRWHGKDVRRAREEFCADLVYLGHANGVKDDLAAWENLVVAMTLSGHAVDSGQAWHALDSVGLGEIGHLPARSLSQGQRKRVALARLQLSTAQPLWILDEPFTALDAASVAALCETLNAHLERGGMLVYTTHQEITLQGHMRQLDLGGEVTC